ncbi:recombination-associated protein RdgC [Aliidiomarina shirensis]|uniref:Recombination-associated protein RdgC n=1 Tax=Aliidiomarina shirensis TaxID=1048642 RepID=A0A432WR23_9GAMM|nr:recombination-associated protein RdgC [Aliidiomarina shirensis]RUO36127.1 recombination-associated protein RdgC [Aliidiomarina shirensis]
MWFKNLRVYQFTQPFAWSEEAEKLLEERRFTPCSRQEPASFGWVPPVGEEDGPLLHRVGDNLLFCAKKEEKVMPASAVNAELETIREQFQQENARPMPRKEQQAMKEEIIHRMLPQALSRYAVTWAMIDLTNQKLMVDTSSASRAEDLTALLRSCLGSLPIKPWGAEQTAEVFFTEWLKQQSAPAPFELGLEAELRSFGEDESIVRFKQHDLTTDEVSLHLQHGKLATQVALEWDERLSFLLTDDYAVKRIRFSDVLKEQRDDLNPESRAEQLDVDFALMSGELNQLIIELNRIFAVSDKASTELSANES